MAITRWDPVSDMMSLRDVMNRLFEDAWVRPTGLTTAEGAIAPALDMYETGDDLVVCAALPGVKPDDINVTMKGDVLRIEGEIKEDEHLKQGEPRVHHRERRHGHFIREVMLPISVKSDQVNARFENGVLTLHLPKAEEEKTRRIQIQGASSTPQIESRAA